MKKKNLIILSSVGVAVVGLSVGGGFAIAQAMKTPTSSTTLLEQQLAKGAEKVESSSLSPQSQAIYLAFAKKITPVALLSAGKENSVAFSLTDAFVSYAMEVYLSSDAAQSSYCAALGANSMEEITKAVQEISTYLGTSSAKTLRNGYDQITGVFGAANINSLWLDPTLRLREDIAPLLKTLGESYYADLYHATPTEQNLNVWLKAVAPAGFDELPEIKVPKGANASCVSSYFLQDHFLEQDSKEKKEQYTSRNHYIDYTLSDGTKKPVDYLSAYSKGGTVGFGEGYTSASMPITTTNLTYYLPEVGKNPFDLVEPAFFGEVASKKSFDLSLEAPYFSINSDLELMKSLDPLGIASLKRSSLEKLALEPESLSSIKQDSLLKLDYQGFYAASATVVSNSGSAYDPVSFDPYDFKLDHPYLFETTYRDLPVFYGVVMDPNYPAFQGLI
jgi:serine protease inhibitor